MKEAGLDPGSVKIDIKKDEVILEGSGTLVETKIVVLGVAEHIEEDE